MLEKVQLPEKDKEKWRKVMRPDMMTSEESVSESEDLAIIIIYYYYYSALQCPALKV